MPRVAGTTFGRRRAELLPLPFATASAWNADANVRAVLNRMGLPPGVQGSLRVEAQQRTCVKADFPATLTRDPFNQRGARLCERLILATATRAAVRFA